MLHLARYSSVTPADFERALGITVGFDSMFDRLFGESHRSETASSFPPYNIRKDEEEKYRRSLQGSVFKGPARTSRHRAPRGARRLRDTGGRSCFLTKRLTSPGRP